MFIFRQFFFLLLLLLLISCAPPDPDSSFRSSVQDILADIHPPVIPNNTLDLIEFSGHQPDSQGSHDFLQDIQRAIDTLAEQGGGTLLFSNSADSKSWLRYQEIYRVKGPIQLKSNIRLLFEASVMLYFEFDPESYLPDGKPVLTRYEGTTLYTFSPCIRAFHAENIAIESTGSSGQAPIISSDGEAWQRWMWDGEAAQQKRGLKPAYQMLKDINNQGIPLSERVFTDPNNHFFRPALMQFFLCKNVLVDGVKIASSPFWCVHPVFCDNVIVRNLQFDSFIVNNDGVDPESSKNVLIENIMFNNHDDNVAIKAGRDREGREGIDITGTVLQDIESDFIQNNRLGAPTENVVIRNCIFKGHYAIAIGSEMSGGVRHIYAEHNHSVQDVNMGFFIKSSRTRGGCVEDVHIRDLHLNRVDTDVISMIPNYDNDDASPYPPIFRNISLYNVTAQSAQNGIRLYGWHDAPIENIYIQDIKIDQVDETDFDVSQVKNVNLDNVNISGNELSGTYTVQDSANVPHQI